MAHLPANGWLLYGLTWKPLDMPSGPPVCLLRGSVRRTSGTGFSGWPTLMAAAHKQGCSLERIRFLATGGVIQHGVELITVARLAGWVTCTSRDWKDTPGMAHDAVNPDGSPRLRADQLPRQVYLIEPLGLTAHGFRAPTDSKGRFLPLNPAFCRWLMGYPTAWDEFAPSGTP